MTARTSPSGGHRGAEARPLPFAQEPGLLDADVEVVPRECLRRLPRPARIEAGVALPLAQRPPPIAVEHGLEPRLARVLVDHAHIVQAARAALDDLELLLQAPQVVEGRPLKGRPRL